jgi:hypothetical protein
LEDAAPTQEWVFLPDGDPRTAAAAAAMLMSPMVVPESIRFAFVPSLDEYPDVLVCWYQEHTDTGLRHRIREFSD